MARRVDQKQLTLAGNVADGQSYTAEELYWEILARRKYAQDARQWVLFRELRFGTGGSQRADSSMDAFAFNCWPSGGFLRRAYEIKVSRGDFLRELKDPTKRRPALLVSNQFYFLCPPGVAQPEEIPPDCGLIVARKKVSPTGAVEWTHHTQVTAFHRDEMGVSWAFVASLARRALEASATFRTEQENKRLHQEALAAAGQAKRAEDWAEEHRKQLEAYREACSVAAPLADLPALVTDLTALVERLGQRWRTTEEERRLEVERWLLAHVAARLGFAPPELPARPEVSCA